VSTPSKGFSIALALISVIATPVLWFVQFVAMWLEATGATVVVVLLGASTLVLPYLAFSKGRSAGSRVAQVIGGLVGGVALIVQVLALNEQLFL
jgi:hypothetical protein